MLEAERACVDGGPVRGREDERDVLQEEGLERAGPGEVPACGREGARQVSAGRVRDEAERRGRGRRRTDEHADPAEARVKHLVVLVPFAQVLLLGPPQVALLVPVQDVALPVDVARHVLQHGPRLPAGLARRLVDHDVDLAREFVALGVDGALDDGADLDVDAEFAREVLEGREPVGRRGVRGRRRFGGGRGEVGVRVRVLGEVPVGWVGNDARLGECEVPSVVSGGFAARERERVGREVRRRRGRSGLQGRTHEEVLWEGDEVCTFLCGVADEVVSPLEVERGVALVRLEGSKLDEGDARHG